MLCKNYNQNKKVTEIKLRSVFIHVDVPGQEDNAPDIENFPTILELGEEKITILLKILKSQLVHNNLAFLQERTFS